MTRDQEKTIEDVVRSAVDEPMDEDGTNEIMAAFFRKAAFGLWTFGVACAAFYAGAAWRGAQMIGG